MGPVATEHFNMQSIRVLVEKLPVRNSLQHKVFTLGMQLIFVGLLVINKGLYLQPIAPYVNGFK